MSPKYEQPQDERDHDGARARRERDRSRVPRGEFVDDETTGVRTARQVGGVERTVKRLKWWIAGVAIPAISGLVIAANFLIGYARESERARIMRELETDKVERHEKMLEEISSRLREVEATARRNEARLLRRGDAPSDDKSSDHKVTP